MSTQKKSNLLEFLTTEKYEDLNIFHKMNCNKTDFELMRFILKFLLETNNEYVVINYIIQDFHDKRFMGLEGDLKATEELLSENISSKELLKTDIELSYFENDKNDFKYLKFLKNMKNLISIGWVSVYNEEKNIEDEYSFLNKRIFISNEFLELLNKGEITIPEIIEIDKYKNYDEYLNDQFIYIENIINLNKMVKNGIDSKKSPIYKNLNSYIKKLEKNIIKRSIDNAFHNKLINFCQEHKLTEVETLILISLIKQEYFTDEQEYIDIENDLAFLIDKEKEMSSTDFRKYIYTSNLLKNDIIKLEKLVNPLTGQLNYIYYIEENTLILLSFDNNNIEETHENDRVKKIQLFYNSVKSSPIFEIIESEITLNDVILNKDTEEVLYSLIKQTNKTVIDRLIKWGIKKDGNDIESKIIFHGKPGTGKTMAAVAFANSIGKKIISFDCSKLLSMYVGESEKNVKEIFNTYTKIVKETGIKPILLLNEADQFLSKRNENPNGSSDNMHNQMQNIFLEQIERFDGIIIATTNLIDNIDKAFSRRFNYKIEFKTPSKIEREKIWKLHLPKDADYEEGFEVNKLITQELTGGQIDLIVKNTAYKVAVREEELIFKIEDFMDEIKKEVKSSFEGSEKVVGFTNH
jgi:ATP-dependent 26S proteasome regulatory subunit/formylmethanofuran dehydrogenase subunit D